jgi:hypothetical protein
MPISSASGQHDRAEHRILELNGDANGEAENVASG